MSDDITFCGSECNNTRCRRHRSNIKEPQYPHSVALLEGTEYCEKKPNPASVRLIDAEALKSDFQDRLRKAKNWKENALNKGDDELVIRAEAAIDFICEVIMTIDNAPTVELTEEQAIDKLHETGWLIRHDKEMTERQKGEWIMNKTSVRGRNYTCTACEKVSRNKFHFCPNCGADMRKGEE